MSPKISCIILRCIILSEQPDIHTILSFRSGVQALHNKV